MKPRRLNFLPKRDGGDTIQISSSGCDKEKMRRPDLGQNNGGLCSQCGSIANDNTNRQ